MPFNIIRNDITKLKVDAIVNAANTALQMGGGVSGAIFKAASARELQAACDSLAPIRTGEAVLTPGFNLPAKHVIHAAGPAYRDGKHGEEGLLRAAYANSLKRAVENKCEGVAFPLISSGTYGYPRDEALRVATSEIRGFLDGHDIDVTLVVFDKSTFAVSCELLGAVESYIDEHYVDTHKGARSQLFHVSRKDLSDEGIRYLSAPPTAQEAKLVPSTGAPAPIDDLIGNLDEPLSQTLLRLIDAKGKTDVEVYKRANLDRKLFSKIRTGKGYTPSKKTVISLAVALELSLKETDDLLERAGYALSHAVKFDVIVEYFITSGKYDVFEINEVLFEYDQALLGG
jgi:O-acetyl-ADP-ribose deacetylase (regulator of RNase III)